MEILKTKIKSLRLKLFFYFLTLFLFSFSTTSFSQEKFKFGIKGGIGIWRLESLQNIPGHLLFYSYSPGFCLGFNIENKLSENFSLTTELLYQNSIAMETIETWPDEILDQEITTIYLTIPILIKYQTPKLWNTYFFLGPSLSYLIYGNYHLYGQIYHYIGDVEITKNLTSLSTSIEFGFGKELEILNSNFNLELRAQWGLTKFHFDDIFNYIPIGTWKNSGLMFLVGYEF